MQWTAGALNDRCVYMLFSFNARRFLLRIFFFLSLLFCFHYSNEFIFNVQYCVLVCFSFNIIFFSCIFLGVGSIVNEYFHVSCVIRHEIPLIVLVVEFFCSFAIANEMGKSSPFILSKRNGSVGSFSFFHAIT